MPNEPTFCRPYNGRRTTVWPNSATIKATPADADKTPRFTPRRRRRALSDMPQPKPRPQQNG